jgi:hypothetical protein
MPFESEKQRRAAHAAAKGEGKIGIPQKAAKKMVAHDPGGKLPEKKEGTKSPDVKNLAKRMMGY